MQQQTGYSCAAAFRAARGSFYEQSLTELYHYAQQLVRRHCLPSQVGDPSAELIYKTRNKALQQLQQGNYSEQGKFRLWLRTLLYYEWRTWCRHYHRTRYQTLSLDDPLHQHHLPEYEPTPDVTERDRMLAAIHSCLPLLPARQQRLLQLYYYSSEPVTVKVVAQQMGETESWVKANLSRTRQKIFAYYSAGA